MCILNARSLKNKLSLFQSFALSTNHYVICVTETWLNNHIYNQEILPPNYNIFRRDRESRGGGVLIAVKNNILVSNVSTSNPNLPEAITITLPSVSLTLSCTYISPNCNEITMSEITSYISNNVMNRSENTILVGNFNLPDINSDTLFAQSAASNHSVTWSLTKT